MLFIKVLLLFMSIIGWISFLTVHYKIRSEFAPAVFCASCSSIMFFAGILNILTEISLLFLACGWILLLRYFKLFLIARKRNSLVLLCWFLVLIYFLFLLKDSHFTLYDNFSHWAIVIKNMMMTNRMPNFKDTMIQFQSYPLGSALFIYYISKILGDSDGMYLFAQMIMLISFLLPIFAWSKKDNLLITISALLFSIYSLISNIPIYDLLVDTLMPLAGVSMFGFLYYYKKDPIKGIMVSSSLFIFLINVKNSGIFFVIVGLVYFCIHNYRKFAFEQHLLKSFFLYGILLPFGIQYLWKKHISLVFDAGNASKHAMTFENYKNIFANKSMNDILDIGRKIVSQTLSWESFELQLMFTITILLSIVIIHKFIHKQNISDSLCFMIGCWSVFIIYICSIFAMYVFSMPLGEAVGLAGYSRYLETIIIYLLGITMIHILYDWESTGNNIWAAIILSISVLPVWGCRENINTLFIKQNYEATQRYRFQSLKKQYQVENGGNYFIYIPQDDHGYLYYLARYELWTNNITFTTLSNFHDHEERLKDADYLIIWQLDSHMEKFLDEQFGVSCSGINDIVISLH